jgi:hypothetical protein
VDELLDIRSRLSAPIERLHRALSFVFESLTGPGRPAAAPVPNELHGAWRETVRPAIESITATVRGDYALRRISAGIPGTVGEAWPGLALIGPAAPGHESVARVDGDERTATTAALAAAWRRRRPDHEVRLPPFFLLYRTGDPLLNVNRDADRAVAKTALGEGDPACAHLPVTNLANLRRA